MESQFKKKWAKNTNIRTVIFRREFTNAYVHKETLKLIVRKLQIKTTLESFFIPIKWANIRKKLESRIGFVGDMEKWKISCPWSVATIFGGRAGSI